MSLPSTRNVNHGPASDADRLTPDAFAEAFTARSRTLWCIAAGILGKRAHAEDVLQEGAMIALSKLDQFDPGTSFVAWMGQIVRYVALNHARRVQRSPHSTVDPQTVEAMTAGSSAVAPSPMGSRGDLVPDQSDFDDEVVEALGGLEETARACLLLRTVMQMPYRDISLALGIPEGTAMSHVHRARSTIRDRLPDRAPNAAGSRG